jgi:MYXO-CTERM domain-containing protein
MVPGLGRAQSCASDADCAKGLSCQTDLTVTGGTGICYVGDGGRVCTTTSEPPVPTKSCRAATCTSDTDCGATMVCYKQTVTTCTNGAPVTDACKAGTTCVAPPPPVPETCTATTTALCTYRWALPCNADADCGTGFVCKPSEMGMCSGGSGTAGGGTTSSGGTSSEGAGGGSGTAVAASPVDAAPVAPPTCTTIVSYPGYCQAKVTTCTADADCPSPWMCQGTYATTPIVAVPSAIDGGPTVAVPVPPAVDPVPVTKTCQRPPTYADGTRGGTESTPTKAAGDGGATVSLSSPDAGAATGATKPPTPTPPGATNSGPTETVASTSGGGGCSVSAGQGAAGSAWLALAALALLVARRGRKRAG